MAEFIEFLSDSALAELKKANAELVTMVANVDNVGKKMKNISTPSGSDSAIKSLTEQYKQQEKVIEALQKQLQKYAEAKAKQNKLTSEEIVNQRALAQASDRHAKTISAVVGAYQNLNAKHQQAKKNLQDLVAGGRRADETQAKYNRTLKQAQKEFDELNKRVLKADKAVGVFNRNVGNYPTKAIGGLKDLLSAFGVVGGATGIAMLAKDIYETTKQLQSLNMALLQVSGSQEKLASTQAFLTRISEAYGVEIMGLTKQFTQFYVSAKDKISGQEIEDIFESVTKASASMGLTQEQTERAFLALNQMMSKGTVSAEELRGQLGEALPGAFGIMAKAMGVTERQLGKMMKDGQVLASDVLPKFARQLEITYGIENVKRIDNIVNAQARLGNSWTALVATFAEGEGVLSTSLKMIMDNASFLLDVVNTLAKSQKQLRAEELKEIATNEEKKTVIAVQEMQKRGKSEADVQKYITEQIAIESKKRRDIMSQTNKLQQDFLEYATFEARENAKRQIPINNELIAKQNGIIEGLKKLLKPEQDLTDTENKKDKKEKVMRRERIEALELTKEKVDSLIRSLEEEKAMIEELQMANSTNNAEWEMYQKVIDGVQTSIDNIKNGYKDLQTSAMGATDEFIKNEKALKLTKESLDKYNQAIKDSLELYQSEFFSEAGFPTLFKALNDDILGFGENFAVTFNTIAEIAQETFNFISELSNQRFQAQYDNLAKEKEVALRFARESASAREEIERQYEQKQKEIRKREFKAQKQQALFNIAINGAQAIIATLARTPLPLGLPLILATSALTAVQLGVVASQKVPEYWMGTDNAPQGLALTQERGREIITDSRGNIKSLGSDKGAELTYLNKGDKVFNAEKTMDMLMFDNSLNNMLNNSGISMPNIELNAPKIDLQPVIDAINSKESAILNIDKSGFKTFVENGRNIKEITNNKVKFIGKSV